MVNASTSAHSYADVSPTRITQALAKHGTRVQKLDVESSVVRRAYLAEALGLLMRARRAGEPSIESQISA